MLLIKKWRRGREEGKYKHCNFQKAFLEKKKRKKYLRISTYLILVLIELPSNAWSTVTMWEGGHSWPWTQSCPLLPAPDATGLHRIATTNKRIELLGANTLLDRVSMQKETGRAQLAMLQKMLCPPNFLMWLLPKRWRRDSISAYKPLEVHTVMPPPKPSATAGQGEKRCRAAVEQGGRVAKQQPAGGGC